MKEGVFPSILYFHVKGFVMRWLSVLGCLLISFVWGMSAGINVQQDEKVKKPEQKKEVKVKESLVQKSVKDHVEGLIGFPYHQIKHGRKIAEIVTSQFNLAEEVFEESERLRAEGKSDPLDLVGSAMIRSDLRNIRFLLVMRKDQMAVEGLAEVSYVIHWDGKKWAVKDLPKKDKK